MTKAQNGFVADSGVQQHSAGEHFPITEYHVGGWPPNEEVGKAFFVAVAPCGIRRRSWNLEMHKMAMETFGLAQRYVSQLDASVVDEKVGFWLALDALEKKGHWTGFPFGDYTE